MVQFFFKILRFDHFIRPGAETVPMLGVPNFPGGTDLTPFCNRNALKKRSSGLSISISQNLSCDREASGPEDVEAGRSMTSLIFV